MVHKLTIILVTTSPIVGLLLLYNTSGMLPAAEMVEDMHRNATSTKTISVRSSTGVSTTKNTTIELVGDNHRSSTSTKAPSPPVPVSDATEPPSTTVPTTKGTTPTGPLHLPNILFLGAQKAGSSAVADWLFAKEQGVCGGKTFKEYNEPDFFHKEMHYFDNNKRYERGIDFYMKHYEHCSLRNGTFIMDATPNNLGFPERAYETYKDHPVQMQNLKVILVIREPMSRDLSLYNHMLVEQLAHKNLNSWTASVRHKGNNTDIKSFTEFVQDQKEFQHPTANTFSYYAMHLTKWFQYFDPKQILVLTYEEDVKPGAPAKKKLNEFLGHPFEYSMAGSFRLSNSKSSPHKVKILPCSAVEFLQPVVEAWNQKLYDVLANTPRPSMETLPFPKFQPPKCDPDK